MSGFMRGVDGSDEPLKRKKRREESGQGNLYHQALALMVPLQIGKHIEERWTENERMG